MRITLESVDPPLLCLPLPSQYFLLAYDIFATKTQPFFSSFLLSEIFFFEPREPPKFSVYQRVEITACEAQIEKGLTKFRWSAQKTLETHRLSQMVLMKQTMSQQ